MWHTRYKSSFKTSNPNLIITAVQSFPNMNDTVEKISAYCKVKELQADAVRLEIESFYWLMNGRDFIPLYFENDCPKLKRLRNPEFMGKSFFWCIGYRNPALTFPNPKNHAARKITTPTYKRFKELLKYSLENLKGDCAEFLFEYTVKKYLYEVSQDWGELQKSRRFKLIENTSLNCLYPYDYKNKLQPENYFYFLKKMEERGIYEFMFNEFK